MFTSTVPTRLLRGGSNRDYRADVGVRCDCGEVWGFVSVRPEKIMDGDFEAALRGRGVLRHREENPKHEMEYNIRLREAQ